MIPRKMLSDANKEPSIAGRVRPRDPAVLRVPIMHGGAVVGFYCPHAAACGRTRIGPIYIAPEFRGRGLATAAYRAIEGPMMAAVLDGDEASERMHARAGFVRWRRFARGWHWRRG